MKHCSRDLKQQPINQANTHVITSLQIGFTLWCTFSIFVFFKHQWRINGGRCGTCGDPFDDIRQHEEDGLYDNGFISRNYTSGSNIILTVRITSNHRGWFEFKLCPTDQPHESLDKCLDDHILEIDGGTTQHEVGQATGDIEVKVKLPQGLSCRRCILQWKYNTGKLTVHSNHSIP